MRADTYQEAFAFAADYACRVHLHLFRTIPVDLTVRVMFMSERALGRHLSIRRSVRTKKQQELKLMARVFTHKQLSGARLAALGPPTFPNYSIFKYVETKDLRRISTTGKARTSIIEIESSRPKFRKNAPAL